MSKVSLKYNQYLYFVNEYIPKYRIHLEYAFIDQQSALERTKGIMPEFVNPKYADAEKTVFKKPTRLECMMQVGILGFPTLLTS